MPPVSPVHFIVPSSPSHHSVCACICVRLFLCLFDWLLTNDLNPISIRVQDKGDTPHTPIRELLLELVALVFQSLACCLDIVDADSQVTEALVWFCVTVVHLVVFV